VFNHLTNQIWLDYDGVLVDFNKAAIPLLDGLQPEEFEKTYGTRNFWKRINSCKYFFRDLELMPDAMELYDAVKHLYPIILTGIPNGVNPHANQKHESVMRYFGHKQEVICCLAREKSEYCLPGDVLVDDRIIFKHLWEAKQGHYIIHTSAKDSIRQLKEYGVI
jgi:5'(3')-deoxyribonucleotidase